MSQSERSALMQRKQMQNAATNKKEYAAALAFLTKMSHDNLRHIAQQRLKFAPVTSFPNNQRRTICKLTKDQIDYFMSLFNADQNVPRSQSCDWVQSMINLPDEYEIESVRGYGYSAIVLQANPKSIVRLSLVRRPISPVKMIESTFDWDVTEPGRLEYGYNIQTLIHQNLTSLFKNSFTVPSIHDLSVSLYPGSNRKVIAMCIMEDVGSSSLRDVIYTRSITANKSQKIGKNRFFKPMLDLMESIGHAVFMLNSNHFYHGDCHTGNWMLKRGSNVPCLIDFDTAFYTGNTIKLGTNVVKMDMQYLISDVILKCMESNLYDNAEIRNAVDALCSGYQRISTNRTNVTAENMFGPFSTDLRLPDSLPATHTPEQKHRHDIIMRNYRKAHITGFEESPRIQLMMMKKKLFKTVHTN